MVELPTGTVTMLFSDIEGSTALLSRLGSAYADALDGQRQVLRKAWAEHGGIELGTEGDSFFVVFSTAEGAVAAAAQAQRDLASFAWPRAESVRVRMGIHTGTPQVHQGGYVGMDVHRAARIAGAAHGGQVVVSQATAVLMDGRLPEGVALTQLGTHQLKDLPSAERLYQLRIEGLQRDFPPLKSLGAASSLPRPATPLVGRAGELAELTDLLGSADVRLVTLTGPGGSGKTRLALGLAQRLIEEFPDGVYFVPLATVTTADSMWTSIADVLDLPPEARVPPALLAHVAPCNALVTLDNLEQLPGADHVVDELLEAAQNVTVLATSRRPLHVAGEYEHPVPPLELPENTATETVTASGAVQMFIQHARMVRPGFEVTADNAADVAAVCRRLDGLPLAIELAAARSKLFSPAALLARLDNALELKDVTVQRPPRQQTLYNAIEWSYDLLEPGLRRSFRRLGVFAGGCDLDAISAVLLDEPPTLEEITELVDFSLLMINDDAHGEPRASMLQLISDFALDRLIEHGECDLIRQRHAQYYLAVVETLAPHTRRKDKSARDRIHAELDNVRAALTWTLMPDQHATCPRDAVRIGLRLVAALWWFWFDHGYRLEARRWLERAVEVGSDDDGPAMATALFGLWVVSQGMRGPNEDPSLLSRSLSISESHNDQSGTARAMVGLALFHQGNGDIGTARAQLEQGIALSRQVGDDTGLASALYWSANLELRFGSLERARERSGQACEVACRAGDDHAALSARMDIAWSLVLSGQAAEALEHLHGLADDVLKHHEPWLSLALVWAYSAVFAVLGDAERAASLQGTYEVGFVGDDPLVPMAPDDLALIERCYSKARPLISADAWQRARQKGRTDTLEQAITDARRAAAPQTTFRQPAT